MERFFHFTDRDTESTKEMEDICRQQSGHHPRRNSFSSKETCAIAIQSCWSHLKRSWTCNSIDIHTMVEGTTMAYTGAIQLASNRGQHPQKIWKSEMCMLHFYNFQKTSHKDSPSRSNSTELLNTAEESSTADILRPTGKQLLYPHKILTRL